MQTAGVQSVTEKLHQLTTLKTTPIRSFIILHHNRIELQGISVGVTSKPRLIHVRWGF